LDDHCNITSSTLRIHRLGDVFTISWSSMASAHDQVPVSTQGVTPRHPWKRNSSPLAYIADRGAPTGFSEPDTDTDADLLILQPLPSPSTTFINPAALCSPCGDHQKKESETTTIINTIDQISFHSRKRTRTRTNTNPYDTKANAAG
jgi:hypothetical protein